MGLFLVAELAQIAIAAGDNEHGAIWKSGVEEAGEPNAETLVELSPASGWGYPQPRSGEGACPQSPDGLYRLTPRTGRTHQLRVHMTSLGLPIYGDPLYPNVIDIAADDFSTPLQLLAQRIEFDDPLSWDSPRVREFATAGASALAALSAAKHGCEAGSNPCLQPSGGRSWPGSATVGTVAGALVGATP